jgi:hypothetical protein
MKVVIDQAKSIFIPINLKIVWIGPWKRNVSEYPSALSNGK